MRGRQHTICIMSAAYLGIILQTVPRHYRLSLNASKGKAHFTPIGEIIEELKMGLLGHMGFCILSHTDPVFGKGQDPQCFKALKDHECILNIADKRVRS